MSEEISKFEVKKSFIQKQREFVDFFLDLICFFIMVIPLMWFEVIKRIFVVRKIIKGRLAIVTGAGGGLGKCLAHKLADLGCNVAVVDINVAAAEAVSEELRQKGVRSKSYRVDITKIDEIRKLREDVKRQMGNVTLLINNAGIVPDMKTDAQNASVESMIKVNILGTILMTRSFINQMKESPIGGHIVAISSMSGLHPTPFAPPYSATKAAVNAYMAALTERLRIEKVNKKIKLSCICPYYITTRKDIVDFLNPDIRLPPLNVEDAADQIIDAVLRETNFITIPYHFKFGVYLTNFFPLSIQQLIRELILKEGEFKSSEHRDTPIAPGIL